MGKNIKPFYFIFFFIDIRKQINEINIDLVNLNTITQF